MRTDQLDVRAGRQLEALADPTRRSIVAALRHGPQPVGRLADQLPVSRPAVSQHLKVLKDAGLVDDEAAGTRRLYRLTPRGPDGLRAYLDRYWSRHLAAYAEAVTEAVAMAVTDDVPADALTRGDRP